MPRRCIDAARSRADYRTPEGAHRRRYLSAVANQCLERSAKPINYLQAGNWRARNIWALCDEFWFFFMLQDTKSDDFQRVLPAKYGGRKSNFSRDLPSLAMPHLFRPSGHHISENQSSSHREQRQAIFPPVRASSAKFLASECRRWQMYHRLCIVTTGLGEAMSGATAGVANQDDFTARSASPRFNLLLLTTLRELRVQNG